MMDIGIILGIIQDGRWYLKMFVGYSSMFIGFILIYHLDIILWRLFMTPHGSGKGQDSLDVSAVWEDHKIIPGPPQKGCGKYHGDG